MGLAFWREEKVPDRATALERARAGAAFLDKKFGTHWDEAIDLDELDIASPCHCILGQLCQKHNLFILYVGCARAVECGFSLGVWTDVLSLVYRSPQMTRGYDLLGEAWRLLLRERRALDWKAERRVVAPGRSVGRETGIAV